MPPLGAAVFGTKAKTTRNETRNREAGKYLYSSFTYKSRVTDKIAYHLSSVISNQTDIVVSPNTRVYNIVSIFFV